MEMSDSPDKEKVVDREDAPKIHNMNLLIMTLKMKMSEEKKDKDIALFLPCIHTIIIPLDLRTIEACG